MADDNQTETADNLRSLGVQIDNVSEAPEESQPPTVESEPSAPPEAKVTPPAEGTDKPKPESAATDAAKPEEKEPSKYEKERKRRAEAWQKIEAEKAEIARQRSELESQRPKEQPKSTFKHEGYTADEYQTAARAAWEDAQKKRADLDDAGAKEAEQFARDFQEQAQVARQLEHRELWNAAARKTAEEMAELRDPKAPLTLETGKLLEKHPFLTLHPDGARVAPMLAKAQMDAAAVPALKAKVEELTKENERLVKLTSLPGDRPAKQAGEGERNPTAHQLRHMAATLDGTED